MKIFITGASGFLGRNLIDVLIKRGDYGIYALTSQVETLSKLYNKHSVIVVDKEYLFQDYNDLDDESIIINCAFPRNSNGIQMADGLRYIQQVFETGVKKRVVGIINISSQSVYSQKRKFEADETEDICLESTYAVGKYATELMLESICKINGIHFTNIRLGSLIGVGFEQRIVNKLVRQAYENKRVLIKSNEQIFGFLDVRDAAIGIVSLVEMDSYLWAKIYNLGNENGYTLEVIADKIRIILKEYFDIMVQIETVLGDEQLNSTLNMQRLTKDTGFKISVGIEKTIFDIVRDIMDGESKE